MKKLCIVFMILAIFLCGCQSKQETTETTTAQQPDIQPLEGENQPAEIETQPATTETTVATEATETQAVVHEVLVTDGEVLLFEDKFTQRPFCVHIPQFTWDGQPAEELNEKIYAAHMEQVYSNPFEEGNPSYSAAYSVGKADGVVTVLTKYVPQYAEGNRYSVFCLDTATGKEADTQQLLAAFGYTEESFRAHLRVLMEETFRTTFEDIMSGTELYDQMLEAQLSDETILNAVPFVDEDGRLCVVILEYGPAGAGYWYSTLCVDGPGLKAHIGSVECQAQH